MLQMRDFLSWKPTTPKEDLEARNAELMKLVKSGRKCVQVLPRRN